MKQKYAALFITLAMVMSCAVNVFAAPSDGVYNIYVSSSGSDYNDGSLAHPYKTLTKARDRIRTLRSSKQHTGAFTVYMREGTYEITNTVAFDSRDSGLKDSPVTFCAYNGEKVTLTGGKAVSGSKLKKVTDSAILDRLSESSAREHIYSVNLAEEGITDVGQKYLRGAYSYTQEYIDAGLVQEPTAPPSEVLYNGGEMTLARFPNSGYLYVTSIKDSGWDFDNPSGHNVGAGFTISSSSIPSIPSDRLNKWAATAPGSVLMYGYWKWDWADQSVPISSINLYTGEITSQIGSFFGVANGKPFYVYDLLEEIDAPGEYWIDYANKMLYMYPPSADYANAQIMITSTTEPLIQLDNVRYMNFVGINVTGTRGSAYAIKGGSHNSVSDCEISYTENRAVTISGTQNGIKNSYIHDVEGGVTLTGGDNEELIPGQSYVENCEIERFSRLSKTYVSAVSVGGVGNTVKNCEIHNAPHLALEFGGNNNIIEYNEIYDVCKATDDAGAIYGGLSWIDRGNIIRNNYIHDLESDKISGGAVESIGAIYLDGGLCETIMTGNVFENIKGKGIWLNGGRDNTAKNNVFINCTEALRFTDIMFSVDLNKYHYPRLEAASYATKCPWKRNFPKLQNMLALTDDEKKIPAGNLFAKNVAYNTKLSNDTTSFSGKAVPVSKYIDLTRNIVTNSDPGFVSLSERNYAFSAKSDVFAKLEGFENIEFDKMGVTDLMGDK